MFRFKRAAVRNAHYVISVKDKMDFQYAKNYILNKAAIYDEVLLQELHFTLSELINGFSILGKALLSLVKLFLVFIFKVVFLSLPYLQKWTKTVVEFHKTQLTYKDMIFECVLIFSILFYIIFRQRIKMMWKKLENKVAQSSKSAATMAPHVLFFTLSLFFSYFGQKFLIPLSSKSCLPLFTTLVPLSRTITLLLRERTIDYKDNLVLWTILSVYYTFNIFVVQIPFFHHFSNYIFQLIPISQVMPLVIIIWIQTTPLCANLVYDYTQPILFHYVSKIPISQLFVSSSGSGGSVTSVIIPYLRFVGVSDRIQSYIKGLLSDTLTLAISLLFMFFPSRLAYVGVIIVCLLLPAYKSSLVVSDMVLLENANATKVNRAMNSTDKQDIPEVVQQLHKWLQYWVCMGLLLLMYWYHIRLWASSMMLTGLWLQNTYFEGANKVWVNGNSIIFGLVNYRRPESESVMEEEEEGQGRGDLHSPPVITTGDNGEDLDTSIAARKSASLSSRSLVASDDYKLNIDSPNKLESKESPRKDAQSKIKDT